MSGQPGLATAFLGEPGRRVLGLHFRPAGQPRAHVVYFPPFGEEMNRCRALAAEQARAFRDAGIACTLVDPFGTGDSEGEFSDADLDHWRTDIDLALEAWHTDGLPLVLWGMRLGGLLAMDYAARCEIPVRDLLLWQPVTAGKRYFTQVLRQRVAALASQGLPQESTQDIRRQLAEGEVVEVSGYPLGDDLAQGIEALDLAFDKPLCSGCIHWLEHVVEPSDPPSTGCNRAVEKLRSQGNTVELITFSDPPLWQLHKRDRAVQLLALTAGLAL